MPAPRESGWRETFLANLPIPLIILALWGANAWWDGHAVAVFGRSALSYERLVMLCGFSIIIAVSLQLINGFSGQFSLGHAGFMAVGAYMAAYPTLTFSDNFENPCGSLWFFIVLGVFAVAVGLFGAGVLRITRTLRRVHPQLPLVLMIGLVAWLLIDLSIASNFATPPARFVWSNTLAAIVSCFNWLLDHGRPIATRVSTIIPQVFRGPLCFVIVILGGGGCAGVVGLLVGGPALRLRGDYLAIATLGLAEIIRVLIQTARPLGAALGLTNIPKYTSFAWLYAFVVVTIIVIWRVAYSAKGRAIVAVREDEIAAGAMGVDTTHHKVMAFVIGSFFAGVAGALYALHEQIITPTSFSLQQSILAVVMVTLGGLGSITGAILAAIILTLLPEVLRDFAEYRMVVYAALLIGMMLLRPQGLLGGRELWPKRWR